MEYQNLNKEDFDAVVTGELTHYALWLEEELNKIISNYFITDSKKHSEFKTFFLYRDGLTFQDKIEIVRGMLPLFYVAAEGMDLKSLLKEIEEFKSWRNALAHGLDVSLDDDAPLIRVQVVTRSGKERIYEITQESHESTMKKTENLLARVQQTRKKLIA
jgi:hypothetical protein